MRYPGVVFRPGKFALACVLIPLGLGLACKASKSADTAEHSTPSPKPELEEISAWGESPESLSSPGDHELLFAEIARNADSDELASALAKADPASRKRAQWSLGRIGGDRAAARLMASIVQDSDTPNFAIRYWLVTFH